MAFHLHRLKLFGAALYRAGFHRTDAADLSAGRFVARHKALVALADRLGVTLHDLTRPLTAEESRAWAFYRSAAANPDHVWRSARIAWTDRSVTDKEAAHILGYKPKTVSDAQLQPFTMSFAAAMRLTTALNIPGGPEALLPPEPAHTQHRPSPSSKVR